MLGKYKIYIQIVALLSFGFFMYKAGANGVVAKMFKTEIAEKAKDVEKVKDVNEAKVKTRVIYRDRIIEVQTVNATACADTSFADMGLLKRASED